MNCFSPEGRPESSDHSRHEDTNCTALVKILIRIHHIYGVYYRQAWPCRNTHTHYTCIDFVFLAMDRLTVTKLACMHELLLNAPYYKQSLAHRLTDTAAQWTLLCLCCTPDVIVPNIRIVIKNECLFFATDVMQEIVSCLRSLRSEVLQIVGKIWLVVLVLDKLGPIWLKIFCLSWTLITVEERVFI